MLKVLDHEAEDNAETTEGAVPTLDEVAREGARRMLTAAMEDEVVRYIEAHADARGENGRRLVVRNGHAQSRTVTCGAGTMKVRAPRVNDQRVDDDGERQRFTSRILPPYMRRSPQVAEVLPLLYLRGLSTGDFREALPVLLGKDAAGLSPTNIARLTAAWDEEYQAFRRRDLSACDYVYVWVDGIHFNIRLEEDRLCTLVMIGVTADGTKELVALEDGYRESTESWASVLRDLRDRGLRAPAVAIGDGALGFLVGDAGRVAGDDAATRLVPQDGERAGQAAQAAATTGEAGAARDHVCADQGRCREGDRRLRGGVRGEVPEGDGVHGGGPGGAAGLLCLSRGALAAPADVEPDRIAVRDGPAATACDQGGRLPHQGAADGVQAAGDGAATVASAERGAPAASGASRSDVR